MDSWRQAENYARGTLRTLLSYLEPEEILNYMVQVELREIRMRSWIDLDHAIEFLHRKKSYHEKSLNYVDKELDELRRPKTEC